MPCDRQGFPVIGDRIYIGPNTIVIGGIEIGNDVAIGAGAVVMQSVPVSAVVAGNPAKILSYQGSFEMVSYKNMEKDTERIKALEQRDKLVVD
jgi:serine O-acetyltransferase